MFGHVLLYNYSFGNISHLKLGNFCRTELLKSVQVQLTRKLTKYKLTNYELMIERLR